MTFARMIILAVTTAAMTKLFIEPSSDLGGGFVAIIAVAFILWAFTGDPLPDAIDRALDRYANKWRNR